MKIASGKKNKGTIDPLTAWAWSAHQILVSVYPGKQFDEKDALENMLMLIQAIDEGKIEPVLSDPGFMSKTEDLLLVLLRGTHIEVTDVSIFAARKEIFAAAHVIYNQAVVRGMWVLPPEIRKAMQDST
jgi:hypothetical protein